ncbi:hypothetical protein IFR05_013331 [Cadophora sp. M221]|nr:hypothetical protein IFR05_013331 [Cadophora sp. M221]
MDLFNGQLHQQHAGGSPNALTNPLCESPRVEFPPIPHTGVHLSPSVPPTRIYHHPYVKVLEDSSADDSDLPPPPPRNPRRKASKDLYPSDNELPPPRPRGYQNRKHHKAPLMSANRSSRLRRFAVFNVPDNIDVIEVEKFIDTRGFNEAWKFLQWWMVPETMYWPWPADEAEAQDIVKKAEANPAWNARKSSCVFPGNLGVMELFSTYTGDLLRGAVHQTQTAIAKSREAAKADSPFKGTHNDMKMWPVGCDFTIFSRSERIGRQNTPIVPFNVDGTCAAAQSFADAEVLMRKLAHLELISVLEPPNDVAVGHELAKIAYAFFKGQEIPEYAEFLPTCPDARPKEFYIDYDGASDRAKVVDKKPMSDPVLAVFLQDVMISNYLEQLVNQQGKTMAGLMRVHRHSTSSEVKEKLKDFEKLIGNGNIHQTDEKRQNRQRKRREAWWEIYSDVLFTAIAVAAHATTSMFRLRGILDDDTLDLSPDDDGDTTTEAGESSEETANSTESSKSKRKSRADMGKSVACSASDNSSAGESSTILPASESDVAAPSSTESEMATEATPIAAPSSVESTIVVPKPSSEITSAIVPTAPAQPAPSVPASSLPDGKSKKKNNKNKKRANAQASSDAPSGSGFQDRFVDKPSDVQPSDHLNYADQSAKEVAPAVSRQESATKPGDVPNLDALGISMSMDSEDGAWETVKPRSTLKAKVTVSSGNAFVKGSFKGPFAASRAVVSQPHYQQGPRVVAPVTKGGQPSKVTSFKPAPIQPKDARVFDPNEYPAMPTPPADKSKTQGKVNLNPIVSQTSQFSALPTTTKTTPVILAITPKASSTVTPKPEPLAIKAAPEVDSDPEDLYGASPPRKTRAVPVVIEKVISTAKPAYDSDPEDLYGASPRKTQIVPVVIETTTAKSTKLVKDDTATSKSVSDPPIGNKQGVPEFAAQTAKNKKTSVVVPKNGPRVDKKPEVAITSSKANDTLTSGPKDVGGPQFGNKTAPKSSTPATNVKKTDTKVEKSTTNPKADPKASNSGKSKGKGKAVGSANPKSKIATPAVTGSNDSKGKASTDDKSNNALPAVSTSTESNDKGKASDVKSTAAVPVNRVPASNHSKTKDMAPTSDSKIDGTKSSLQSDVGQTSASGPVADGPEKSKKSKKSMHRRGGKHKGSDSRAAPAEISTTPMPAESEKPVATDNANASNNISVGVPTVGPVLQNIPPAKTPVEDVAPTVAVEAPSEKVVKSTSLPEPSTVSEHVQPIHVLPTTPPLGDQKTVESKFDKQEVFPVPDDLAWADLVSPTKPGHLKRRLSLNNTTSENDNLEDVVPEPVRRSSISAGNSGSLGGRELGELPVISSTAGDDPFVSEVAGPDVSFTSSSTEGEVGHRDSRTSPEVHITPRTELMLTPASPDSYNGEPYINIHGQEVTLFRRDAEISNFPGQKHHQRAHSGPGYGNRFSAPPSNPIQGRSAHGSGPQAQGRSGYGVQSHSNFNSGQGTHSHPQPAFYGALQSTGYAVHQGDQGKQGLANVSSLGGDLKGKGPEMGVQGSMTNQSLSPIPEVSISSETETEEANGHNPPTKCTFCEQLKVPTAANPLYFCPLCGVAPGLPRYCSRSCLLANSWEHAHACRNSPAYSNFVNTDLGPTYNYEAFPLNNCHFMPDSAEKYRQKMFATFCKYGEAPDIRHAHSKKWPNVDWSRVLPSRSQSRAGDYHIFKSQATHTDPNLSRSHVICTIKFPAFDPYGFKFMITRALNVAFVTHDINVINFLGRLLRAILMDPRHFQGFGAVEPQEIVMMEFKSQFYKEFGVIYNDAEPLINPQAAWKTVDQVISNYEAAHGILFYWLNAICTRV